MEEQVDFIIISDTLLGNPQELKFPWISSKREHSEFLDFYEICSELIALSDCGIEVVSFGNLSTSPVFLLLSPTLQMVEMHKLFDSPNLVF